MKEIEEQIKGLRFLQPNNIDQETLNNPEKLKAYFDWKYENFEDEYKVYCKAKKDLLNSFLDALSPEKKDLSFAILLITYQFLIEFEKFCHTLAFCK